MRSLPLFFASAKRRGDHCQWQWWVVQKRSFSFIPHSAFKRRYYEQTTNTTKSFKRNKNLFKNFTVENCFNCIFNWLHCSKSSKSNKKPIKRKVQNAKRKVSGLRRDYKMQSAKRKLKKIQDNKFCPESFTFISFLLLAKLNSAFRIPHSEFRI